MKLPRDLSGEALVKHFCKHWEYLKIHQVGSHAILSAVAAHKSVPKETILKDI